MHLSSTWEEPNTSVNCFFLVPPYVYVLVLIENVVCSQVECKKAQPKEVMLPANLAKTRAAGRGAYGELGKHPSVASGGVAGSGVSGSAATFRYAPYPLPASSHSHHSVPLVNLVPTPVHYTPMYDVANAVQAAQSVKRAFAMAAALRPQQGPSAAAGPTLSYSMSDLLGVQGLDVSALYHTIPATVGL